MAEATNCEATIGTVSTGLKASMVEVVANGEEEEDEKKLLMKFELLTLGWLY